MRYIIQAVPERQPYVEYLLKRIPHAEVYWDEQRSPLDALAGVMELAGEEPFVRLEDDIVLCQNFQLELESRAQQAPHLVSNFFWCPVGIHFDIKPYVGGKLFPPQSFLGFPCAYFPAGFAPNFIPFLEQWAGMSNNEYLSFFPYRSTPFPYQDFAVADYIYACRGSYIQWLPSLVQHRLGYSAESEVWGVERSQFRITPFFKDDLP